VLGASAAARLRERHRRRRRLPRVRRLRPTGQVVAIKYRPLDGSSHDSRAEAPSTWLLPPIFGKRDSLEWFVVEGETDTARLLNLVPEGTSRSASSRSLRVGRSVAVSIASLSHARIYADDVPTRGAETVGERIRRPREEHGSPSAS
jgi:hypothetical protein